MAEANIPMYAIISRCGWETKSLYTIFRYVFASMSNNMRFGKNPAQWFYKVSSDIYVSVNPTLDYIWTDSQMVHLFVDSLFVQNNGLQ